MYQINLLPWREKRFKKIIAFAVLINLILWVACLFSYITYKNYLNISNEQQTITQLNNQIKITQDQLAKLNIAAKAAAKAQNIKKINADLLDTLIQISKIIPENTRLELISMTPEEITIIGQAANQAEMTTLSQNIFNLIYFNKQKSWTISERANDVNFKLVLKHESENNSSI